VGTSDRAGASLGFLWMAALVLAHRRAKAGQNMSK
jgi:hypothetical protein